MKTKKKFLSMLLTLAMVTTMLMGMTLTAFAYSDADTTNNTFYRVFAIGGDAFYVSSGDSDETEASSSGALTVNQLIAIGKFPPAAEPPYTKAGDGACLQKLGEGENYEYYKVTKACTYAVDGKNLTFTATGGSSSSSSSASASKDAPHKSAFDRTTDRYSKGIKEAKTGSSVKIKGDASFNALPNSLMKDLLKKKDVDLEFSYEYKGMSYTIKIPAGAAENNDIPWYGPMYLWGKYGVSSSPVVAAK